MLDRATVHLLPWLLSPLQQACDPQNALWAPRTSSVQTQLRNPELQLFSAQNLFLLPASSSSALGFGWGKKDSQINVLKQFALAQSHDIKSSVDFPHVSEHPEDSS